MTEKCAKIEQPQTSQRESTVPHYRDHEYKKIKSPEDATSASRPKHSANTATPKDAWDVMLIDMEPIDGATRAHAEIGSRRPSRRRTLTTPPCLDEINDSSKIQVLMIQRQQQQQQGSPTTTPWRM